MRPLLHLILSAAMWCLFGYYWYVVLGREIGPGTMRAVQTLLILVVAGLVVTVVWVAHNLRLARKFAGRRCGAAGTDAPKLERDTIGRPITHPALGELRAAGVIDIEADAGAKRYRVAEAVRRP
ncbi:MAG TPA: hypothetical protein PLL30_12765 [Candidatus Krumholzibacteria bacterium]|nr:hypothetical protein [Candidatus Krumholzibacteria bacterium]HPD72641.1 hypothetical protein [Candidatus Krumholzibacteria bacterium]HRY40427.1 hypothetical protein [Candidatus Krumholzibacteria bacterium]